MKRLFGTDGIRAVAGESPLDPPTVRKFGAALAEVLVQRASAPCRVVLGRDTRESGSWLCDAVAAGLGFHGVEAVDTGVVTTPGLACIVRQGGFSAGVMISASHNPFQDNGLKAFSGDGIKLSDALEEEIERRILDTAAPDPGDDGRARRCDEGLVRGYVRMLEGVIPQDRFRGLRLCLDCANGSAASIAPSIFRHYGAELRALGDAPDGRNINLDCGSLHLDRLANAVRESGFDLGLAFDGDADRCLGVDRHGRVVDGDHVLYIAGRNLKRRGHLKGNGLVSTVMSNFWLEERLGQEGIRMDRAPVGDKYVLERMLAEDLMLGGEQSGHVIFREYATTGDGILTGLLLLDMLRDEEQSLEQILDGIVPYPQLLLNVKVNQKPDLRAHAEIGPVVEEVERALEGSGRVVLRYSGTEPLARVMIEGRGEELVREQAERLADVIRRNIGC